ncbi:MAG: M48 family metallopeptidase [Alphaproteobacteria bacterium]|nr:M48 family metallopeptidase [Alphaproteobacteria bacterium]MDA8009266.1 M48 family metallopeptidase [Alphaproteobacteria bacterium]MDA8031193.1 M48 family metallopeptidase [Alphaproteobacteria bacterium]
MVAELPPLRLRLRPVAEPPAITLPALHENQNDLTLLVSTHPRARNLAIRLDTKAGHFILTKPPRTPLAEAQQFARKHQQWLHSQLAQLAPRIEFKHGNTIPLYGEATQIRLDPTVSTPRVHDAQLLVPPPENTLQTRLQKYLRGEAGKYIRDQIPQIIRGIDAAALARSLRQPPETTAVRLTDPATRWGSCSHNGRLAFSWRLVFAPRWVSHYVIVHEVAHLYHFNHSRKFWSLVDALAPRRQDARRWLQKNGDRLLRYGPPPAARGN